jgi:hypothetical protein
MFAFMGELNDLAALRASNLAVKFLLELAAISAFAYWGGTIGSDATPVLVAVAAPLLAVVLWGVFAAPSSTRRLPLAVRAPFELGVFALAALALLASVSLLAAGLFAGVAALNAVLLTVLDQWEQ